jgi:hypothetical protein
MANSANFSDRVIALPIDVPVAIVACVRRMMPKACSGSRHEKARE